MHENGAMTGGADSANAAAPAGGPPRIGWKLAALLAAILISAVAAAVILGSAGIAPAALGGVVAGLLGAMTGTAQRALAAVATALVLGVVWLLLPTVPAIGIAVPVLAALAAREEALQGGRSFVFALFGWVVLTGSLGPGTGPEAAAAHLATFALAGLWGIGAARMLGIAGIAPERPAGRAGGLALFAFLTAGVLISYAIIHLAADPHSTWIAQMFVMRGLAPPAARLAGLWRFGIGTIAGALIAGIIVALDPPALLRIALAGAAFVLGLKTILLPRPLASAAIATGAILVSASTIGTAVFRVEAAAIVAILTVALSLGVEAIRSRLAPGD